MQKMQSKQINYASAYSGSEMPHLYQYGLSSLHQNGQYDRMYQTASYQHQQIEYGMSQAEYGPKHAIGQYNHIYGMGAHQHIESCSEESSKHQQIEYGMSQAEYGAKHAIGQYNHIYGMGAHQQIESCSEESSKHQQIEYEMAQAEYGREHAIGQYNHIYRMGVHQHREEDMYTNALSGEQSSTLFLGRQDNNSVASKVRKDSTNYEINRSAMGQPSKTKGQILTEKEFSSLIFGTLEKQNEGMESHSYMEQSNLRSHYNSDSQLNYLLQNADVYDMDAAVRDDMASQSNIQSQFYSASPNALVYDMDSGVVCDMKSQPNKGAPSNMRSHHIESDSSLEECRLLRVGNYIKIGHFRITEDEFNKIYKDGKFLDCSNYTIITKLNKLFEDIPCVLISNGPYARKNGLWVLRYFCKHEQCQRFYKVYQIKLKSFVIYRNKVEVIHDPENPICRPVNKQNRVDAQSKLVRMLPEEYLQECEDASDKDLLAKGNMQDMVSMDTAKKMRSDALAANDFHKDEIIDLLMMKVAESQKENEPKTKSKEERKKEDGIYLRRICLDPFVVLMFNDQQFECLKLLCKDGGTITIFFDATGGVVKHGGKVIYYYAGVTRDTSQILRPHEKRKILQLFESVNGAHDAFNIGLILSEYKYQFHAKFPTLKWPIEKAVTDMSYAIINAICHSWNRTKLIDYINLTYEVATGSMEWSDLKANHGIETQIRVCCGHISKNYAKDVVEHFPNMTMEHQAILKEIFAGMFDLLDIQKLKTMWTHFSTILLSRYKDENVTSSLTELARIITSKKKTSQSEDESDDESDDDDTSNNDRWKLPDSDEHDTIYSSSRFYQEFKKATFDNEFTDMFESQKDIDKSVNPYHSHKFCDMFLKKYVSILSLWTCAPRIANSPAESNFKNTKKEAVNKAVEIGTLPLKCGRFVRFLKTRAYRISGSILVGAPRYRCTKNKRRNLCNEYVPPAKKRKIQDVPTTVLSVYQVMKENSRKKKETTTKSTSNVAVTKNLTSTCDPNVKEAAIVNPNVKKSPRRKPLLTTTNSTSNVATKNSSSTAPAIDDPNAKEAWSRKPKRKFSYFNAATLQKVNDDSKQLTNLLHQSKQLVKGKSKNNNKMTNDLVDRPATYLASEKDFVVASLGTLNMSLNLYKQLLPNVRLSNHLIAYVLSIFGKEYKTSSVQFEIYKSDTLIKSTNAPILKLKKKVLLAVYLDQKIEHFMLIIVNCQSSTFSLIDPLQSNDVSGKYFENFLNFVDQHNETVKGSDLPSRDKWSCKAYDHETQDDNVNCGIYVLQYIKQYLKTGKICDRFSTSDYRIELQHLILRKSIRMTGRCLICGLGKMLDKQTDWVKCDCCNRWTHIPCAQTDENELFDDSIHFFCVICTANTSRPDLRSMTPNVVHFETFSQAAGRDTSVNEYEDDSEIDVVGENDTEIKVKENGEM